MESVTGRPKQCLSISEVYIALTHEGMCFALRVQLLHRVTKPHFDSFEDLHSSTKATKLSLMHSSHAASRQWPCKALLRSLHGHQANSARRQWQRRNVRHRFIELVNFSLPSTLHLRWERCSHRCKLPRPTKHALAKTGAVAMTPNSTHACVQTVAEPLGCFHART